MKNGHETYNAQFTRQSSMESESGLQSKEKIYGNIISSSPITSPKFRNNEITQRKLYVVLEELKDIKERLKCTQLQCESLTESNKHMKKLEEEHTEKIKNLEWNLREKCDMLVKFKKDMDQYKTENYQLASSENSLREKMVYLRDEKQNLSTQLSKDKIIIQDLQRQCKEMENILTKRHPDSVSALIVTSKNTVVQNDTKVFLEKRILDLENELKNQDESYQKVLTDIQSKVNSMKKNYEVHIRSLEQRIDNLQSHNIELKCMKSKKMKNNSTQTELSKTSSIGVQTLYVRPPSVNKRQSVPTNQNNEYTQLIATVKGLNSELDKKNKDIFKLTKDLEKLKCVNAKPDKTKKVPINLNEKLSNKRHGTTFQNSKKDISEIKNKVTTVKKQSLKPEINGNHENSIKNRMKDLFDLQTAHLKELTNLTKKVSPLESEIKLLNSTIDTLRSKIKIMEKQLTDIVSERNRFRHNSDNFGSKANSVVSETDFNYE